MICNKSIKCFGSPAPPQGINGIDILSFTYLISFVSYPSAVPSLSTEFNNISPAPFFFLHL